MNSPATRCHHESWDMEGRLRVIHRCKNRTKDPTGLCHWHRDSRPGMR